jgi:DnaK suppressor protein
VNDRRRDDLRKFLVERKRKMWNELRDEVFRKLGSEYNSQFDIPNDLEDLSVIDFVEDLGLTLSDLRKEELSRIDESLRKLDQGTYGVCERCSSDIDVERLKIDASATHCLKCQSELEKMEGKKKPTL